MLTVLITSVLPWLLLAVGTWLGYQLVRQNGRILLRLETIEKLLAARAVPQPREPQGLSIGTPAPDFELPDLSGNQHRLSEFRGRELLLVFFNPQCGFCTAMADDLAALPTDGKNGRPLPLVITSGDIATNRQLIDQHGMGCTVLRQEQMEVAAQYHAAGTPMGYRIDADGRIASELAAGAEALLRLAEPDAAQHAKSGKGKKPHGKEPDPSLSRSRLKRDGLKAGAVAPEFRLPRIDGGELSLADLRGGRVLLVFSDPDCGPCDEVAPLLQEVHESRPDLQVVVISRRDGDATRIKAEKLGLTYRIVMQKQWEISLKYAMFATPIGYLIDEEGVLLSDVAVGVRPILALAERVLPGRALAPSHNGTLVAGTT
jgi:peroxiredoxin